MSRATTCIRPRTSSACARAWRSTTRSAATGCRRWRRAWRRPMRRPSRWWCRVRRSSAATATSCAVARRDLRLVHLQGRREVLAARAAQRQGHYMPVSLLDSQFAILEPPGADERALTLRRHPRRRWTSCVARWRHCRLAAAWLAAIETLLSTENPPWPTFTKVILFTDTDGFARFREEQIPLGEGTPQAMLSEAVCQRWLPVAPEPGGVSQPVPLHGDAAMAVRAARPDGDRPAGRHVPGCSARATTSIRSTCCPKVRPSMPRCTGTGAARSAPSRS